MKIVINISPLAQNPADRYACFIYQLVLCLTKKYAEHEFILISDRPIAPAFLFDNKIPLVVSGPQISNRLQHSYWYGIKLPLLLKRYRADIFISSGGFCSFNTSTPQCVLLPDLSVLHSPSLFKRAALYFSKQNLRKMLEKAQHIITLSNFSRHTILANYSISDSKINTVKAAANHLFRPLTEEEKEQVKSNYTHHKNYFICAENGRQLKNHTNLLKAFSVFKKRQKSDWKLVIALLYPDKKFIENLRSYKYRSDVIPILLKDENELALLAGSSYAIVNPSLQEDHGIFLYQAMSCSIPIIAAPGSAWEEIAGDAVLYANVADYGDMADKMMLLYKDEVLRGNLIAKGQAIAAITSLNITAEQLWGGIRDAIK